MDRKSTMMRGKQYDKERREKEKREKEEREKEMKRRKARAPARKRVRSNSMIESPSQVAKDSRRRCADDLATTASTSPVRKQETIEHSRKPAVPGTNEQPEKAIITDHPKTKEQSEKHFFQGRPVTKEQPVVQDTKEPDRPVFRELDTKDEPEKLVTKGHKPVVQTDTKGQKPVVREQPDTKEQKPVVQERTDTKEQTPVVRERTDTKEQKPVVRERTDTKEQKPVVRERTDTKEQKPVVRERTDAKEQKPVVQERTDTKEQKPVVRERTDTKEQKPVVRERTDTKEQKPVVQERTDTKEQKPVVQERTDTKEQKPVDDMTASEATPKVSSTCNGDVVTSKSPKITSTNKLSSTEVYSSDEQKPLSECKETELPDQTLAVDDDNQPSLEDEYKKALREGPSVPTRQLRVMAIGPPGAGKTSLLQRLTGKEPGEADNSKTGKSRDLMIRVKLGEDEWHELSEKEEIAEIAKLLRAAKLKKTCTNPDLADPSATSFGSSTTGSPAQLRATPSPIPSECIQDIHDELTEKILKEACLMETTDANLDENTFLYVWDCMGQSVYLNALPPFLSAATVYLLVINANECLENNVKLNESCEAVEDSELSISYEDLLTQWMAAIDSYVPRNGPKRRLIIVGTHTSSQAANRSVIDSIPKRFEGRAFCDLLHREVMLVDCKQNTGDFQKIRRAIQDIAKDNRVKVPVKWILFRKILTIYSKNNPQVSYKMLYAIAKVCNISKKSVSSLVDFYHELGVIFSCPGHDCIIANPKWLAEKFGNLLCHEETLLKVCEKVNAVKLFCNHGILVKDLCEAIFKSNSDILIHILDKFFLAAEITISLTDNVSNGKKGYFVPTMLTRNKEPEENKFHLVTGDLYIQIPRLKYLPPGLFVQLVVALAKRECFTPDFDTASYNCVRFYYQVRNYIATVNARSNSHIKITFGRLENTRDSNEKSFHYFCQEVFKLVTEVMQNVPVLRGYKIQPALKCNCSAGPHFMAIASGQELERDKQCSLFIIDPNSKLWLSRESREIHVDDRTPERILRLMNQILKEERSVDDLVKSLDIPRYDHSNPKMNESFLEYLKVWVEADTEEATHTILYHLTRLNFNQDYINRIKQLLLTTPPIEEDHIDNDSTKVSFFNIVELNIQGLPYQQFQDDEDNSGLQKVVCEQPDFDMEDSKESQGIGHLRGVEVIAQTSVTIKAGEERRFEWKGYGFRLHAPKGALPPDLPQCTLRIQASLSGQFHFPEGSALVSAIYWISAPATFSKPLKLEIQHSCDVSPHNLKFVKAQCTQKELPYRFEPIKESNEVFTEHSSYGSISITKFSGIGIVHRLKSLLHPSYLAQVFLSSVAVSYRWKVFFVVTKDLDVTKTLVQQKLGGPVKETSLRIKFATEEIMVTKSESTDSRWQLEPKSHPCIIKAEVDGYSAHVEPPKCEFIATWTGDYSKPYLPQVELHLEGAKSPRNFCKIDFSGTADVAKGASLQKDKPTLGPDHLSELFETVKGAKEKWSDIGTKLGLGRELDEIPRTIGLTDDSGYFRELLKRWLNRAPPQYSFPRVEELASAHRQAGMHRTAYDLEHHSFTDL